MLNWKGVKASCITYVGSLVQHRAPCVGKQLSIWPGLLRVTSVTAASEHEASGIKYKKIFIA